MNASSFGWNAEDSTAALQAAFDSGANKVVIDRQAGDWISRPLFITNSNIEVVLADGVTLKANSGHPGAPMGMADLAVSLWLKFLRRVV